MEISHPEEFGCPLLVAGGYSHTPTDSWLSQPHSGTEYQTRDVLHPSNRKNNNKD